jgi:hypothetical protein
MGYLRDRSLIGTLIFKDLGPGPWCLVRGEPALAMKLQSSGEWDARGLVAPTANIIQGIM